MAHLHCDFSSECLKMNTAINVVLPEKTDLRTVRVVYLFHGLMDNCSGWYRYSSVERYARLHNVALVTPEVQRSFYTDMALGVDYFRYVSRELPEVCRGFFGFSPEREKNYVMGLSMGGYGALKCALTYPEQYAGVAAFSAVTDIRDRMKKFPEDRKEFQAIFGPDLIVPDRDDLFALAEQADPKTAPRILTACGEEDSLFEQNRQFAQLLTGRGFDETFTHWTGIHDWVFWDRAVMEAMDAMFGGEAK